VQPFAIGRSALKRFPGLAFEPSDADFIAENLNSVIQSCQNDKRGYQFNQSPFTRQRASERCRIQYAVTLEEMRLRPAQPRNYKPGTCILRSVQFLRSATVKRSRKGFALIIFSRLVRPVAFPDLLVEQPTKFDFVINHHRQGARPRNRTDQLY
jgi:hypothetical protein